jgi:hypothetical protein
MPYARSHSKEYFAIAIGNEILTHGGAHLSDDPSLTHRKHTSTELWWVFSWKLKKTISVGGALADRS